MNIKISKNTGLQIVQSDILFSTVTVCQIKSSSNDTKISQKMSQLTWRRAQTVKRGQIIHSPRIKHERREKREITNCVEIVVRVLVNLDCYSTEHWTRRWIEFIRGEKGRKVYHMYVCTSQCAGKGNWLACHNSKSSP